MTAPIELTTTVVRHSRLSGWMTPILLAAVALVCAQKPVTWVLAGLLLAFWVIAGGMTRPHTGKVRVDEEGLVLDGERIGREALCFGHVVPATPGKPARVEILGARQAPVATIHVPEDEGARILAKLGIGAAGTVVLEGASLALDVWITPLRLLALLYVGNKVLELGRVAASVVLAGALAWWVGGVLLGRPRIEVGRDGISVQPPLRRRRRLVPWSEIVSVQQTSGGVEVTLTKGTLALPVEDEEARDLLVTLLDARVELYQASQAVDLSARLARGGRDREAWLRALSHREGDFRSVPISDEQLWSLVESTGTDATARAAAALILARGAGDEDRRRLRIAAAACTSPRLRIVLEEAGEGADEEALSRALDEVEDEGETARVMVATAVQ